MTTNYGWREGSRIAPAYAFTQGRTRTRGAVVLVDMRRLDDYFAAIDYFEDRRMPFAVAVNQFPDGPAYPEDTVRDALALPRSAH